MSYRVRCLDWCARFAAAAAVLAFVELVLLTVVFVTAVSTGLGALQTWAALVGLFAAFGAPCAIVLASVDREAITRRLPSAPTLLMGFVFALLATALIFGIDRALFLEEPEFPHEVLRMNALARAVALSLLFVVCAMAAPRMRAWSERWPSRLLGWLPVLVFLVAAKGAIFAAHFAFAPVHQVAAASVAALVALILLALAFRARGFPAERFNGTVLLIATACVGTAGTAIRGPVRDHAQFVIWGHSTAAGLAEGLRWVLDRDHDAVLPSWLPSGRDCQPNNRTVSPLQVEIPADGIDQDCRGGDAPQQKPWPPIPLPPGCAAAASQSDVLILTVDALRADALTPEVMPALSELAKNSLVFDRAYSPTAMTSTSVPAILSGRAFADLGPQNALLDENLAPATTAPELFRAAGYRTAAVSEFFGYAVLWRGFQNINSYWHDIPVRGVKGSLTSAVMSRGILDALDQRAEPAFVWAHLADTHAHYSLNHDAGGNELSESAAYYRGAAYVDQQLGQILSELQQHGRLKQTIIAVLADHGEELLARGRQGHGPNLFEESIHVPLVLWAPSCRAQRFEQPVSLTHLLPTVGVLAGVDVPGIGLLSGGDSPTVVEAVTGLNTTYKRAVIQGQYKLLLDVANGGRMLFDLERDPQELNNILPDVPDIAAQLESAYQRWLDAPGRR